jgi:hypothetical protein
MVTVAGACDIVAAMETVVRLVTGLGMVALIGFMYVAWHEWRYWSENFHNQLAGVLAVAGASGAALSLAVVLFSLTYKRDRI